MGTEIWHHGILGQKWGKRNGPPYPLSGGDYSKAEREEIYKHRSLHPNSIYNKKHFDEVLSAKKTTLSTLSYDPHRIDNADMFYAAHTYLDKAQYQALFNRPIEKNLYDENGKEIGSAKCLKVRIDTKLVSDMKIASEDSGAKYFKKLYSENRDFYNFVTDPNRMESYFVKDKYKFKGYREAKAVLDKLGRPGYVPSEKDISTLYRLFNYVIPYDGGGTNARGARDVATQRAKFFKLLKESGYGGVLDTNDAIYGGFKGRSPVIIFDGSQIVKSGVYQTKMSDKALASMVLAGRKILGV